MTRRGAAIACFAPLVALTAFSGVAPILSAVSHSLFLSGGGVIEWSAFAGYRVLFSDRALPLALAISVVWALAISLLLLVLSLPVAVLLHRRRAALWLLTLPLSALWIVPMFIATPVWRMVFHGNNGVSLFSQLSGIEINLLTDPVGSFAVAVFVSTIHAFPPAVFVLFAALRRTPLALIECARIEGATDWELFRIAQARQIRPFLFVVLLLAFIQGMQEFTVPFLLTAGGPPLLFGITPSYIVGATTTVELYLYDLFRFSGDMSVPSAYATLLLGLFFGAALIWYRARRNAQPGYPREMRLYAPRALRRAVDTLWHAAQGAGATTVVAAAAVFLYVLLWTSFSLTDAIFVDSFVPRFRGVANYASLVQSDEFLRSVFNSAILAAWCIVVTLVSGAMAAAFAAVARKNGRAIFVTLQFFRVSGGMHSLIPLFALVIWVGAVNTYWPIVALYSAAALPLTFFLLYGYFSSMPDSWYESARLEGVGAPWYAWRVLLPLSGPVLVSAGLFAWVVAWNGFLIPLVFLTEDSLYPASVYLHTLVGTLGSGTSRWGAFAAGSLLNVAALACLFVAAKRPFTSTELSQAVEW